MKQNYGAPAPLINVLFEALVPRGPAEAQMFLDLMSELWNNIPRYELRGRTPMEVCQM